MIYESCAHFCFILWAEQIDVDTSSMLHYRLEKLWKEELKKKGPDKASFGRVVFGAAQTRIIFASITFIFSVTFSFVAPVSWYHANIICKTEMIPFIYDI